MKEFVGLNENLVIALWKNIVVIIIIIIIIIVLLLLLLLFLTFYQN